MPSRLEEAFRTAVIGGWRRLPYLKFGQGNLTFIREKLGRSQAILKTDVCGNHANLESIL